MLLGVDEIGPRPLPSLSAGLHTDLFSAGVLDEVPHPRCALSRRHARDVDEAHAHLGGELFELTPVADNRAAQGWRDHPKRPCRIAASSATYAIP